MTLTKLECQAAKPGKKSFRLAETEEVDKILSQNLHNLLEKYPRLPRQELYSQ